jgi:hypothetical protein
MIRAISLLGMTGGFLVISPSLRGTALVALGQVTFTIDRYSPFSYIALALGLGVAVVFSLASPKSR